MNRKHVCALLVLIVETALFGADQSPFCGEGMFIPEVTIGVEDVLPSPPSSRKKIVFTNTTRTIPFGEHNFKRPVPLRTQKTASPFGLGNSLKYKASKAPSFAIPCNVLPENKDCTSLKAQLQTIKNILKEMGRNGLQRDAQFKDLENYIQTSQNPETEAKKTIRDLEERVRQDAKEKLYSLERLITTTNRETDNQFTLSEENKRLLNRDQFNRKSPVDQLRTLQTVSPIIFQYAADNQERKRLQQEINSALTNDDTINKTDKENIADTLQEIEKTSSQETQLSLLRNLHRTYIAKKCKVKSPVNFADKMTEEHEFVAQAYELETMHGLDNAWGNNKLHRGPSPDELKKVK